MFRKRYRLIKNTVRHNVSQVLALTEKNIKLETRFKFQLLYGFINPIITILMPLIIFQTLFNFNKSYGPWNPENYAVFILSTYNLYLLKGIISDFPIRLRQEKFWKTLPALIIAPFNRFDLLFGIFLSHLIIISIPFIIFFIMTLILYPISLWTFIFVSFIYMLIALIFSGIGLFLGVFAISRESIWRFLTIALKLVFWASCISYPFEIFPESIQSIISLNPFYYVFSILRMAWIQNNFILTLAEYWYQFIIILVIATVLPIIAVSVFNKIFRKYGIVGY